MTARDPKLDATPKSSFPLSEDQANGHSNSANGARASVPMAQAQAPRPASQLWKPSDAMSPRLPGEAQASGREAGPESPCSGSGRRGAVLREAGLQLLGAVRIRRGAL